jgi:hypothetical protein
MLVLVVGFSLLEGIFEKKHRRGAYRAAYSDQPKRQF